MAGFRGTPLQLDTFLEPVVRYTLLAVALPITAVLWFVGAMWWLPVPGVVAFIVHQAFFWSRADRPTMLTLDEAHLTLVDPIRGAPRDVAIDAIEVATVFRRVTRLDVRLVLLFATAEGPQLALQLSLREAPTLELPSVDIDEVDALLGGQAGVLRSIAPLEFTARQTFTQPAILDWCRAELAAPVWARTGLQLWQGIAPSLSPFGFYVGEAHGWLVLDGRTWRLVRPGGEETRGEVHAPIATTFRRTIELLRRSDDGPEDTPVDVTYLSLELAPGVRVAFPAPLAAGLAETRPACEQDLQCHAAEGAALVTHLRRALDEAELPSVLVADSASSA